MRTLTAIVLLLVLTACAGTDDDTAGPSAPSGPSTVDTLDVTVTDPGGTADPARVTELLQTVSAALASEELELDACPLGGVDTFVAGPVPPPATPASFTAVVHGDGVAGQVPTVVCLGVGFVEVEVSSLPGGVTAGDLASRISGATIRPTFSDAQPLVGGEVFVGCSGAESGDTVFRCAATWVQGDLAIHVDVADLAGQPQELADYVSAALPVWVAAR